MTNTEELERESKSQVKRNLQALKKLGIQLTDTPAKSLMKIPMPDELREAALEAKQLKRGALARQVKFIAALLRKEDEFVIRQALSELQKPRIEDVMVFHEIEQWRDSLIAGDNKTLDKLYEHYPELELQFLRQLIRNARNEQDLNKASKSSKAIFRYLSELRKKSD